MKQDNPQPPSWRGSLFPAMEGYDKSIRAALNLLETLGYIWVYNKKTKTGEWQKDYSGINVHIPPEHRATPRGNK